MGRIRTLSSSPGANVLPCGWPARQGRRAHGHLSHVDAFRSVSGGATRTARVVQPRCPRVSRVVTSTLPSVPSAVCTISGYKRPSGPVSIPPAGTPSPPRATQLRDPRSAGGGQPTYGRRIQDPETSALACRRRVADKVELRRRPPARRRVAAACAPANSPAVARAGSRGPAPRDLPRRSESGSAGAGHAEPASALKSSTSRSRLATRRLLKRLPHVPARADARSAAPSRAAREAGNDPKPAGLLRPARRTPQQRRRPTPRSASPRTGRPADPHCEELL